jgi:uncharacterized Zn finger protein
MDWDYYDYGGFPPYVSKAEKMRRAEKAIAKLRKKKGANIEPVVVKDRKIARTWWGKSWCHNLERYADYSNRISRGRSYVRNGSVLDLKISPNAISALVSGSDPTPYSIKITIKPLEEKIEKALMAASRTSLDSMQSLLFGEFPPDLKEAFFKQGTGLFPTPKEIELDCSCPDYAEMCKHVAAALYGVGVRLDEKPELFFVLRGIKIDDFVGKIVKSESEKMLKQAEKKSDRALDADAGDLSELFGIEVEPPLAKTIKRSTAKPAADRKKSGRQLKASLSGKKLIKTGEKMRDRKSLKKRIKKIS